MQGFTTKHSKIHKLYKSLPQFTTGVDGNHWALWSHLHGNSNNLITQALFEMMDSSWVGIRELNIILNDVEITPLQMQISAFKDMDIKNKYIYSLTCNLHFFLPSKSHQINFQLKWKMSHLVANLQSTSVFLKKNLNCRKQRDLKA